MPTQIATELPRDKILLANNQDLPFLSANCFNYCILGEELELGVVQKQTSYKFVTYIDLHNLLRNREHNTENVKQTIIKYGSHTHFAGKL